MGKQMGTGGAGALGLLCSGGRHMCASQRGVSHMHGQDCLAPCKGWPFAGRHAFTLRACRHCCSYCMCRHTVLHCAPGGQHPRRLAQVRDGGGHLAGQAHVCGAGVRHRPLICLSWRGAHV